MTESGKLAKSTTQTTQPKPAKTSGHGKESDKERIESDIRQLHDSFKKFAHLRKENEALFDMAERYGVDTKYHLDRGDFVTAFGCINYAHGLLDSLKFSKQ